MNIDRREYDHPEHFDDMIREYRTSERYIPTALEELLYELAMHRCTICNAPWMETHHIVPLEQGGLTVYDNLIVLCPNCHTRVHKDNTPSVKELRQYKLKQEIAYELPVLSKVSERESAFLVRLAGMPFEDRVIYSERLHYVIEVKEEADVARREARKNTGYTYLEATGIVLVSLEHDIVLEPAKHDVVLEVRLIPKGIKWLAYLIDSNRINLLCR